MPTLTRFYLPAFLALVAQGCHRDAEPSTTANANANAALDSARLRPYPPGRWRLVDPLKLDNVVVAASHILIRHDAATTADPCFSFANWHSDSGAPRHTRHEAFTIARQLRERAANDPKQFTALAAQHSEDVGTRDFGGSLGGVKLSQLRFWPEIADTVARLAPDEVSEVIETDYGFHIIQRHAPPREEVVTGRRIVIAHKDAGWLPIVARGEVPFRSREDALALANEVYARATASPETFDQLIEKYSEHRDAIRGGDLGTWSTREPSPSPRELLALSRLVVGQVAPPIDSPVGFEIIQRTPNREREWYSLEQVLLPFNPEAPPGNPAAKDAVLAKATDLLQQIHKSPGKFDALKHELCCTRPMQWMDGRGSPALTALLAATPMGEMAADPVQSEFNYVIAKRVGPTAAPSSVATYELPEPREVDIEFFVKTFDGGSFARVLRSVATDIPTHLALPPETIQKVTALHDESGFSRLQEGGQRLAAYRSLLQDVGRLIGSEAFSKYRSLMNDRWETFVFENG